MRYSVACTEAFHSQAVHQLIRTDGQEEVAFALYHPSRGANRLTGLVTNLLSPHRGDRTVHGNVSFAARFVERALNEAVRAGCGLALLHSHPGPGWQGMSTDDVCAEQELAVRAFAMTDLPLLGMTIATDGVWSARFWEKTGPRQHKRQWCETVRVVGDRLRISYHEGLCPRPTFGEELLRTVSAWGEQTQADLARVRIGLVGCGSVGMMVGEALAKTGFQHVSLIDYDRIETHNLDRLLYGTARDVSLKRPKCELLAEGLRIAATTPGFTAEPIFASVVEPAGFRAALDCDLIVACVDRPWARSALNQIATAHLIPVVDGGLYIAAKPRGGLRHADWRAHTVAPGRACLECLGQFDPGLVAMEQEGRLDDPKYIAGLPDDHVLKRRENVFVFSLSCASLQLLQMLNLLVGPDDTYPHAQTYRYTQSRLASEALACSPSCYYQQMLGLGDDAPVCPTGIDHAAEASRNIVTPLDSTTTRQPWYRLAGSWLASLHQRLGKGR